MHMAIGVAHDPTCDWPDSNRRYCGRGHLPIGGTRSLRLAVCLASALQRIPLASCALGLFSCVAGGISLCCPVAHRLNADSAHWCSVSAIWA